MKPALSRNEGRPEDVPACMANIPNSTALETVLGDAQKPVLNFMTFSGVIVPFRHAPLTLRSLAIHNRRQ
jgi:hypothetical protein